MVVEQDQRSVLRRYCQNRLRQYPAEPYMFRSRVLYGSNGDQVIICEIASRPGHLHGRSTASISAMAPSIEGESWWIIQRNGHPIVVDRMVKIPPTVGEIPEGIGGLQIARLLHSTADEIISGNISSLPIIWQHVGTAVQSLEIGIQDHHRKRQLQERPYRFFTHFRSKQNNPHTVCSGRSSR